MAAAATNPLQPSTSATDPNVLTLAATTDPNAMTANPLQPDPTQAQGPQQPLPKMIPVRAA